MGFQPNQKTWHRGAESSTISAESRNMNLDDLVEKSRKQAENYVKNNQNRVTAFIGTGLREKLMGANDEDRINIAKGIARSEIQFVPDTIDDLDEQAAFLIALAEELSKPEYVQ